MSPSRAPVLSWTHYTGYWKNGRSEPKLLWDLTTDEFLYLPRHILEFATTENYNKREISMVGRSGSGGLRVDMKKVGDGTNAVNKFWLFPSTQSFFYEVKNDHFRSCPNSEGNILQKALTFLRLLYVPV